MTRAGIDAPADGRAPGIEKVDRVAAQRARDGDVEHAVLNHG